MRTIICIAFLVSNVIAFAQNKISVITQHNDTYRTGWNNKETILNPTNVASNAFGLTGKIAVDDQIYAQPLVVGNLTIGSYTGSVVFVATVNNSLYAFNADDESYGAALWQINLNPTGTRAPDIFDLKSNNYGAPCGGGYRDFSGKVGIVGTPVIDTFSNTLYVVTKTIDAAGNFAHYINAIDIITGTHKTGSPQKINATVDGNGDGSNGGKLQFNSLFANQRPGLLLYNGTVYIAFASHCDWGPYHGWILGYDAATLDLKYTYNATPNGWAGGIWMAGQGISLGDDGNLYVVTGNGTTGSNNNDFTEGRSESLIKLSPQLQMLDWYTPANYQYLDNYDLDYGCDGALLIPNSSLTISGSKEGISYVVDANNMGRFTPDNTQVLDTLEFNPDRNGYVHVHGSPVYAKLDTDYVYAWSESYKLRQFTLDRNTGTFSNEYKEGFRNLDYGMPGAMLSLSSNGNDAASALVWACFPTSGNANNEVRPGTMALYKAGDVSAGELWNSDRKDEDVIGKFAKFNFPTVANGKVYVPTFSNYLNVYGLKCSGAFNALTYGKGSGLKGEYFTNSSSADAFADNATVNRLDAEINFNWGSGSPDKNVSNDVFKARWTGTLQALTTDTYTIYVTASDGVRLWINNNLIIDSWSDKPITVNTATIALQQNKDNDIRLEYYSNTNSASCILQWSANGICKQNIPASQLFAKTINCNSNGTGLNAEYFSNSLPADDFPQTATVTTTVSTVDFDWGDGSPAGISNDNFKARFTGYIQSLDAGTYTFYTNSDDGIRLWVNNQLIIDEWKDQGPTEYSASIEFAACTKYSIKVEYYENGGGAVCQLNWQGPSFGKQSIHSTQLYSGESITQVQDLLVYPNPTNTQINVSLNTNYTTGDNVLMYSMTGQLVKQVTVNEINAGRTVITIPISNLAAGVYIIRVVKEGKTYIAKVMVTR